VRIARVKVGNRQAPYAVRPEPRSLTARTGVLAFTRAEKARADRIDRVPSPHTKNRRMRFKSRFKAL
ncbi:hypothetical protein, partial [Paraburkholderia sp. Ac-20340]|uniref:hypothetical protein n=1 Tax=Paraburkholderia sp. Ac-20340 TaxID=2703888 RepID=UPI00197FFA16